MSETADKMPSPGLLAQASSHYVTLSYYIIRHLACQLFFLVIFNKIPTMICNKIPVFVPSGKLQPDTAQR